ncbi:hypothetical protein [Streptomyces dioscori]|uniref:hypothetical protein n=1 Tax=Streptomyces dioscori TaxID=2109333 RepID=UPI001CEC6BD2|nr:hypothetical protein [Streptomyces dioscori]
MLAAITLTAAAALTLSACGGDSSKGEDRAGVAGADAATEKSASPTASAAADRPKIELPSDLTYTFEWKKTGDKEKDAVLADREQSIKAVDLAIAHQDPLDEAYLYFYEGEAAAQTQQYIEAYVKAKARTTGAYRYYGEVVDVSDADSASLVYCEDQSKGYDMYLKPKKINKTAVTKNSYVLYSAQMSRGEEGAWVVEKLASQRGSAKCRP